MKNYLYIYIHLQRKKTKKKSINLNPFHLGKLQNVQVVRVKTNINRINDPKWPNFMLFKRISYLQVICSILVGKHFSASFLLRLKVKVSYLELLGLYNPSHILCCFLSLVKIKFNSSASFQYLYIFILFQIFVCSGFFLTFYHVTKKRGHFIMLYYLFRRDDRYCTKSRESCENLLAILTKKVAKHLLSFMSGKSRIVVSHATFYALKVEQKFSRTSLLILDLNLAVRICQIDFNVTLFVAYLISNYK